MKQQPPRFARRILRLFCNVNFLEEIEGDLQEQFHQRLQRGNLFKARVSYYIDVFHSLRPYPRMRKTSERGGAGLQDSFFHFLKVTLRNMKSNKAVAFINVAGLAVSLTSFLLIMLYLIDESTFDNFHPHAHDVYRISHSYKRYGDGVDETDARTAGLWSIALKESIPEVKSFTRFSRFGYPGTVRYEKGDKVFIEQQFFWTDATYTDVFALPLLQGGDAQKILKNPANVIINETMATKYFGNEPALGQSLVYIRDGMDFNLIVAGVMKNYPSNAHFHPDFIANNQALNPLWKRDGQDRVNSWRDAFTYSYLRLDEGTSPEKIKAGLRKVFDDHLGEEAKRVWPEVVRLTDLHFTTGMVIELEIPGNPVYRYIFGSIGLLILLIASINYMNLATARSVRRAKEIGLRKTLGVPKSSLIIQFLGESCLTTIIAAILSVGISILCLPLFNQLTSKDFDYAILFRADLILALASITLVIGIVSGIYPAFYLSSFRPVEVLKGKLQVGRKSENFRKVLVVFQFSVTILLIVGTLIIQRQLAYVNDTKLSAEKDQILTVRVFGVAEVKKLEQYISLIRSNAMIRDIAYGTQVPRLEIFGWIDTQLKVPSLGETPHIWQQLDVDAHFPAMFDLEFVAGRNFSVENAADSSAVIINEKALKDLGVTTEKALGLVLETEFPPKQWNVVGIVKDFPIASLRTPIIPLLIRNDTRNAETLYVKMAGNDFKEIISRLEKAWKQIYPGTPFQHWFLDEEFERLYQLEIRTGKIFTYFAGFAVFIGCLGLYGLASFTAEQRTKEIGIRKVMGGSSVQMVVLLTSRFIKLVLVSLVVGVPLAYLAMSAWLESFVYKVEIGWTPFLVSGTFIIFLTLLTVALESLKAALANPVDSIRHE